MSNLTQEWLNRTREQKKNLELLETRLIEESNITLNEYYVLYFLNISEEKEMRLNDLQVHCHIPDTFYRYPVQTWKHSAMICRNSALRRR